MITNFSELKSAVTSYLTLDSATAALLPMFIQLAEAELERLLHIPESDNTETATIPAGEESISLPYGFRGARALQVNGDTALEPVSLDRIIEANSTGLTGKPTMYSIADQALWVSPIPDTDYTLRLFFKLALTPLSDSSPTNWLILQHPDAYLFATIYQTEAYLVNDERAAHAQSVLGGLVNQINEQGLRMRTAGPMRMQARVVV